jgi:RND superfamily putative drug exporter
MLAVVFGLSSDYEIFVVSRIKEQFTLAGDARAAVQRGTALSARVVTSAALIMFSIFASFMFTPGTTTRAFGLLFATGVFLDAFVVRLLLVPATMAIVAPSSGTTPNGSQNTCPIPTSKANSSPTKWPPRPQ